MASGMSEGNGSALLRDLAQWTTPIVSFLLHPLVVVGHRRSVTPHNVVSPITGAVGWADEVRIVRRQTGAFGHPAYWAWMGALEGAIDLLLTATSLSLDAALLPPPAGLSSPTEGSPIKASPYTHSWQTALLATTERLAWTLFTRPLRAASNRLHAQLPGPSAKYPLEGLVPALRIMWDEHGTANFTRSLGPAAVHELISSVVYSLYDASAPLQSLVQRIRPRNGLLHSALQSLSLAADESLRSLLIMLLTRPLQTVVRRLDIQGSGIELWSVPYKGALDCIARIWNEEGLVGFYQGAVPELLTELAPAGVLCVADFAISAIFEPYGHFGL